VRNGLIVDYVTVAAMLANSNDEDQVAFFRVFLKELYAVCETRYKAELQLAMVNCKLTDEERERISRLGYAEKE